MASIVDYALGRTTGAPADRSRRDGGRFVDARVGDVGVRALEVAQAVDAAIWVEAILAGIARGDAILVGRTSDGGALSLQIFVAGTRYREYPSTRESLEAVLLAYRRGLGGK